MQFGAWSLVPPIIAIVLAIATRRIYSSLLVGIAVGAMIVTRGNPLAAATFFFEGLLWPSLADDEHLRVFAFTLLMGAMVGVMRISGGMEGAVAALSRLASNRKRAGILMWVLGLIIFFDDYANTLLLGTSMRPLADRMRISREKLAYIVDSTAAPVAGLALVSTWIAGELSFISQGLDKIASDASSTATFSSQSFDSLSLFIASIPYRFYVIWALLFVPVTILLSREFGPMAKAERRVLRGEAVSESNTASIASTAIAPRHWIYAALPVVAVIVVTTSLLWITGVNTLRSEAASANAASAAEVPAPEPEMTLLSVFGAANSYVSLVYGSLAGLVTAVFMLLPRADVTAANIRAAALEGAVLMLPALIILSLAWTLSTLSEGHLRTGAYLGDWISTTISAAWLPTIVFVLSAAVAFCTGTSWGTMGILMPLAVQATFKALGSEGGTVVAYDPIFIGAIAGVLSGAIFGDHCSPISDTTVLSSQASGCDHVAHVNTQLPYAIAAGGAAVVLGTIPIGFGVSVWVMLPLGMLALVLILRLAGSRCDATM